jgi:hypothetical protein
LQGGLLANRHATGNQGKPGFGWTRPPSSWAGTRALDARELEQPEQERGLPAEDVRCRLQKADGARAVRGIEDDCGPASSSTTRRRD